MYSSGASGDGESGLLTAVLNYLDRSSSLDLAGSIALNTGGPTESDLRHFLPFAGPTLALFVHLFWLRDYLWRRCQSATLVRVLNPITRSSAQHPALLQLPNTTRLHKFSGINPTSSVSPYPYSFHYYQPLLLFHQEGSAMATTPAATNAARPAPGTVPGAAAPV